MIREEEEHQRAVVDLAMEAGELLLENGAEIFRVEDTLYRICRYYGVESAHFFVLSNGILASADDNGKPLYSKVKHIPVSSGRVDLLCAVNQLSREIAQGKYSVEDARNALLKVRQMPGKTVQMQVFAGAVGAAAFCMLFQGGLLDALASGFTGIFVQLFVIFVGNRYLSKIVGAISSGALLTFLCLLCYRFGFGSNLSCMVIGDVMLLIPGLALVNGIRDLANSDYIAGTVRVLDAVLRFLCIAIGVGVTFMAYHRIFGGRIL